VSRSRFAVVVAAMAAAVPVLVVAPASAEDAVDTGLVTTQEVVGTSVNGRPIVAVHRTHEGATRTVLILGNIHGDEQAGLRVFRRLRDREHLPADLDLWLLRTANPDGTAADRRTNAHGVDLNRNFPYRWRSSSPGLTWSGPTQLSEPESVALRGLVLRIEPDLTIIFHQPLFGVGANDKSMPTVRAVAEGMRLPVDDFVCTGVCYGTFSGWVNHRTEGVAVTVEFGHRVAAWRISRAVRTVIEVGSDRR
jgi:murein peptide amidase A